MVKSNHIKYQYIKKMINITIRIPKKMEKEEVKINVQPSKKYQKKIRMEIK